MRLLMEKPGLNGRFVCKDLGEMTDVLLIEGTGHNLIRAGTIPKQTGETPDVAKLRRLVAEFYRGRPFYGITVGYELTDEKGRVLDRGIVRDANGQGILAQYI